MPVIADPLEPVGKALDALELGFEDAYAKADELQRQTLKDQLTALREAYWKAQAESLDADSAAFAALSSDLQSVTRQLGQSLKALQDISGIIQLATQAVKLATAIASLAAPLPPGVRAFRSAGKRKARAPGGRVLRVLGIHGIGDHHTNQSWKADWENAISAAVARWDPSLAVICQFPIYDDLFDETKYPLNPVSYSSALMKLSAGGIMVGVHHVEDAIGEAISGIGSAIGGLFRPSRGLADIPNELRWTAGMVAQWSDYPQLRKQLRDWLVGEVNKGYDIVLAHSLGTLVSYDTFTQNQSLLTDKMTLAVFGSQIGNPFVRGCFGGYLVPLTGPRKWFQLYNPNDIVFTGPISIPDDHDFTRVLTPFTDGLTGHDAVKYLSNDNAINGFWQDAVAAISPSRAFAPLAAASLAFNETMTPAARDRLPIRTRGGARREPNRRALLVGINNYPDVQNRLEGCINDVFLISAALQESGFGSEDIRCVFDDRATAQGILERLQWLLGGTREGDERVFFYSGHGAQIPGYGASMEPDHLNECLVPYDFDWTEEHAISDKQFVNLYSQLPFKSTFVSIFDCCHSGGMSREGGARVRGLTPPDDIRHRALRWEPVTEMWVPREFKSVVADRSKRNKAYVGESGANYRLGRGVGLRVLDGADKKKQREAIGSHGPFMPVIIEACEENELSYEYRHGVTSYGAFTFSMTKELREARHGKDGGKITFKQLMQRTTTRLETLKYAQTPCLTQPAVLAKYPIPWEVKGKGM